MTTRKDLDGLAELLNVATENRYAFSVSRNAGGYRLESYGSIDVSERLPARECEAFMRAMIRGLDYATRVGYIGHTTPVKRHADYAEVKAASTYAVLPAGSLKTSNLRSIGEIANGGGVLFLDEIDFRELPIVNP